MKSNPADNFIAPVCDKQISVIYADQDILLIDKPSGLLSLSGKNPLNIDSVHYRMVKDYPTASMVHRLDFGTSGLMLLALNKLANAHLTKQFQSRSVSKTYLATLLGHLPNTKGSIDAPIAKADFPYQQVCYQSGKSAHTNYTVIERTRHKASNAKITRVLFAPITGRTHQLRVHSLAIGHPIIGCDLYAMTVGGVNSQTLAPRLMLHANSLEFEHPTSGLPIKYQLDKTELNEQSLVSPNRI